MKKKKPRTLKSRIKEYLKNNNCTITAKDILLKFDRSKTLDEAVQYLYILERDDKMIKKNTIPDNGDGLTTAYYYDK